MIANEQQTKESTLRRLEREFEACGFAVPPNALERAWARAESLLRASTSQSATAAALVFARDILGGLVADLAADLPRLGRMIERIETVAGIPRCVLGGEVLGLPQLLQLPSATAVEVELSLLHAFGAGRGVSLWTQSSAGEPRLLAHAGDIPRNTRHFQRLAREIFTGEPTRPRVDRSLVGVLVPRRHQPSAALIAAVSAPPAAERTLLLEVAVPMLTAMLERDHLMGLRRESEEALVTGAERRLARLRYDLHDGPQQDVILLGDDLRLFRAQLEPVLQDHPQRARALGRLDDLQALLVAIDGDLRRIAAFVESPFLQPEALPDALATLAGDFADRTGVDPDIRIRGDFSRLTDSQQITLLGLIREALSNIREHSDAEHVTIRLSSDKRGVKATVTDDGRGFDPETTLVRAAREGHLGLVSMHERVRLLDGQTQIDSRPGGPTVVSVTLPPAPAVDAV